MIATGETSVGGELVNIEKGTSDAMNPLARMELGRFAGVVAFVALFALFSITESSVFPTSANLNYLVSSQAITAIMALSLVVPVATGAFDLSIGGTMTLSAAFLGYLEVHHHVNVGAAIVLAVGFGCLIGLVNGIVVIRFGVNSFIATLGMGSILVAFAYKLLNGTPIYSGLPSMMSDLGQKTPLGVPIPVFYMLVLALVLWYVMEKIPAGRAFRAVGSNQDAARLAGLRTNRYVYVSFVIGGSIAALAGVIFVGQQGNVPIDPGSNYLLPAYAAVYLGSAQLQRGGRINVWGTLVAIYLLALGNNGLQLEFPNNPWIQGVFQGAALIIAVALSVRGGRKRRG